jgi:hypothetical protein
LDFDEQSDKVVISEIPFDKRSKSNDDVNIAIHIELSGSNRTYDSILTLPDVYYMNLQMTTWNNNYILVDMTNRTSRDAAEMYYRIYKWDGAQERLCLYVEVDGVPKNQLKGELFPSEKNAQFFACANNNAVEQQRNDNVFARVNIQRAALFVFPKVTSRTKMYLIKNDQVKIKEYVYSKSDGKDWFLVEYMPCSV